MATRGSQGTSSLFTPLRVTDVLIPDETVQYNERRHWASLIQPFLETIAILIFITMFAGGLPTGAIGGLLFLLAAVTLIVMFRQRKRRRIADSAGGLLRSIEPSIYVILFALVVGFVFLGQQTMAIAVIIATAIRFVYRAAMWAFYVRLYITNRRVIASAGFLGAQINGMPLTRITDIEFRRTVPGELLNYGALRIETAGQEQALGLLTFLNQPDLFYNILIHLSTTAVGAVREPLSEETMQEARAHTIKPASSNRPVRMSLRRRPRPQAFDDGT
jgi:hypothetical protein